MIKIALEGIDGSGKSTQAKMLYEYLKKNSLFYHEPREIREELFKVVEEVKAKQKTDALLSYYFGKDGFLCRFKEIEDCRNDPRDLAYIIRDRDTTISQYAYHHNLGTPDEMNYLMSWILNSINGVDKIIFIDTPIDIAVSRIKSRETKGERTQQDYFEKQEKLEKVYVNYLELFSNNEILKLMGLDTAEIYIIDGTHSIEKVHDNVLQCITSSL